MQAMNLSNSIAICRKLLQLANGDYFKLGCAAEKELHREHGERDGARRTSNGSSDERCSSLTDVAAECGFTDQSHFTREFRRTVGASPGALTVRKMRPGITFECRSKQQNRSSEGSPIQDVGR
jgi:AraC-like DNA-binding protein